MRWLTGAPPCGKLIPCSCLWSHVELHDLSKFRHGAPCEWFELGVKSSSVLCSALLPKCCISRWQCNETAAELIGPYLLISSSLAKILQRLFSLKYVCEVQHKLKCMLSSGPKSCVVLRDTQGVPELQHLILSTLCAMEEHAVFHFLELEESGDWRIYYTDKHTFLSQAESRCFSSQLFSRGPGWGWKHRREAGVITVYSYVRQRCHGACHQFSLIYLKISVPRSIRDIMHA